MEAAIAIILRVLAYIFMIAVPLALIGMRLRESFWGNTICLCNITFASLFALNYFEPLAGLFASVWIGGLFFFDFLAFWMIFGFMYSIINSQTNRLSRVKVHFPAMIEMVGNGVMLVALFLNFTTAIAFSLPLAPFPPDDTAVASGGKDELLGKRARILSDGSLAPFTGENYWTLSKDYNTDHQNRRAAMLANVMKSENKSFLYEGEAPPVRGKNASGAP